MNKNSRVQFHDIYGNTMVLDLDSVDSTAFNADCMDLLRVLPDKCIDLAIVDPPYGIAAPKGTYLSKAKGRGKYPGTADLVRKRSGSLKGSGKLKNRVLNTLDTDWDNTPPRRNILMSCSGFQGIRSSGAETILTFLLQDVLSSGTNVSRGRIHPTQKPVELYEFLLSTFGKNGDLILDTHLGSGSSRIAAVNMGYRFIGCEKNEHFYQEEERRWNCMTTEIEKERNKEQMVLF